MGGIGAQRRVFPSERSDEWMVRSWLQVVPYYDITRRVFIGLPKGGKGRKVPMTKRLAAALQKHRHVRGEYVLCQDDGSMVPGHILRDWLEAAQRRAGMLALGALHKLRHTFCSHLAMRGNNVKTIQEAAGHEDLKTTLRYMHLAPSAIDAAIRTLDEPAPVYAAAE